MTFIQLAFHYYLEQDLYSCVSFVWFYVQGLSHYKNNENQNVNVAVCVDFELILVQDYPRRY